MGKRSDNSVKGLLFCSFCGKTQEEVRKLVAGPSAYICDECIELCRHIVEEDGTKVTENLRENIPQPKEIKNSLISMSWDRKERKKSFPLPFTITTRGCPQM